MNNKLFVRKLFYIGAIAVLLLPLYLLGQPSVKQNGQLAGGGELAEMRSRYRIGQADLGQIDPASESMRLATLGMRGIASAWLWQKAEYYKEEKYFDRFSATLNQIALLQPHFIKVWESQAHNLSYNVSHEFDDYRQRYAWVKKGIDYLIRGTKYNEREPILQWHLGWYTNHKLGRSDEKAQFRELYRNDTEFHNSLISEGLSNLRSEAMGADRKPDNWLTGRLWYLKAYDLVNAGALIKKNEVHFYAEAPWSQMYYSEAIQEEGILDDRSRFAWSRANESWREFGNREILTSWGDRVQLRALDRLNKELKDKIAKFDELIKPIVPEVLKAARESMNDDGKFLIDTPENQLSLEQLQAKKELLAATLSNRFEVIRYLPATQRSEAITLASAIRVAEDEVMHTAQYRDMCNYNYWDLRSRAEQSPVTLAARRQIYEADQFIASADLLAATKRYEKAWLNWNAVFRRYPDMMKETVAEEVLKAINRYLSATDQEIRKDFVLYDFMRYRSIYDGNKADYDNAQYFNQLMYEADRWESAMDQPALLENDHVPLPVDWTEADMERTSVKFLPPKPASKAAEESAPSGETPNQPLSTSDKEPNPPKAPQVNESTKPATDAGAATQGTLDSTPADDVSDVGGRPPALQPPED